LTYGVDSANVILTNDLLELTKRPEHTALSSHFEKSVYFGGEGGGPQLGKHQGNALAEL
jgi:hypothetical protein